MKNYTLYNQKNIPSVGLGTWLLKGDDAYESVKKALDLGYRLIDTAQSYENEEEVGKVINDSKISRTEIFITSKVKAEYKDYKSVKDSIDESLRKLNTDYIDLMLIHSPQPWTEFRVSDNHYYEGNVEAWKALEDAYFSGKVRAIGVSNFQINDLENIIRNCRIIPMVNQLLAHVGQIPNDIISYCQNKGILVEAYSPIAHGEASRINSVSDLAVKYHKSFSQICLKYCLDLGLVVLPKASSTKHLEENIDLNFDLTKEDIELLNKETSLNDYAKADFFPVFKQKNAKAIKQNAGKNSLGEFAPLFAYLNDEVLFGEVWANETLPLKIRSIVTVSCLVGKNITDSSLKYHLQEAKKNGVTSKEMSELITQLAFYAGWPNAWAAFKMAKEVYEEDK